MTVVGYGAGTDSTAMLVGLWQRSVPVDLILFADPGGEDREVAEKIYERDCFFTEQLIAAGVDPKTAEVDACRMEHVISNESFNG